MLRYYTQRSARDPPLLPPTHSAHPSAPPPSLPAPISTTPSIPSLPTPPNKALIKSTFDHATTLFLTRRLPLALETLVPILPHVHICPRPLRTKVWLTYFAILDGVLKMESEEGKEAFGGLENWRGIKKRVRMGSVWIEMLKGYQPISRRTTPQVPGQQSLPMIDGLGVVETEVVLGCLMLLVRHTQDFPGLQRKIENFLAANPAPGGGASEAERKAREGVLELYVLHVLPGVGEWGFAREFVEGCGEFDEGVKAEILDTLDHLQREQTEELRALSALKTSSGGGPPPVEFVPVNPNPTIETSYKTDYETDAETTEIFTPSRLPPGAVSPGGQGHQRQLSAGAIARQPPRMAPVVQPPVQQRREEQKSVPVQRSRSTSALALLPPGLKQTFQPILGLYMRYTRNADGRPTWFRQHLKTIMFLLVAMWWIGSSARAARKANGGGKGQAKGGNGGNGGGMMGDTSTGGKLKKLAALRRTSSEKDELSEKNELSEKDKQSDRDNELSDKRALWDDKLSEMTRSSTKTTSSPKQRAIRLRRVDDELSKMTITSRQQALRDDEHSKTTSSWKQRALGNFTRISEATSSQKRQGVSETTRNLGSSELSKMTRSLRNNKLGNDEESRKRRAFGNDELSETTKSLGSNELSETGFRNCENSLSKVK
ncbi:hypothetical protein BJ508DRAFT_336556 [Ascobolus immersus RN42]|uniref:Uncharacterized protein n=1 Tax=Ascobolus immersus RN42 TaxID=1160509 RepID=A0A3N4H840_ASCIM|nr:hypothetical protein BJ508DRAFT_336556 [Ascobolus immersus RN42]